MEGYQNFQEKLDIKILILFILRRLPDAVTRETLTDLALSEGNAGYFEYSECLAELVDSRQVEQEGNLYKISERGARNCEIVESSLPMTVRQKMEKNIKPVADELRRRAMITASHETADNVCRVTSCSFGRHGRDIEPANALRRGRAGGEAGRELPEQRGEILYADHGAPVA